MNSLHLRNTQCHTDGRCHQKSRPVRIETGVYTMEQPWVVMRSLESTYKGKLLLQHSMGGGRGGYTEESEESPSSRK